MQTTGVAKVSLSKPPLKVNFKAELASILFSTAPTSTHLPARPPSSETIGKQARAGVQDPHTNS